MTFFVSAETIKYGGQSRTVAFFTRAIAAACLILSDLLCFAAIDIILRQLGRQPSLGFFYGAMIGRIDFSIDVIFVIAILFVLIRYLGGDYSRRQLFWDGARVTSGTLLICGGIYLAVVSMIAPSSLIVSVILLLLLFAGIPSARQLIKLVLGRLGFWYQPTAIVGTSAAACEAYTIFNKTLSLGLDLHWIIPEMSNVDLPPTMAKLTPIHFATDDLVGRLVSLGCKQIVLVSDDNFIIDTPHLIDKMIAAGIGIYVIPSLRRLPLYGMNVNFSFGSDLLLLQMRNNLGGLPQRALKRSLDIAGSLVALLLLSPLFVVVAFLIWRENGGPVFFIQSRVGRYGKNFKCLKFRTMVVDAEEQMESWHTENPALLAEYRKENFKLRSDPRVTKIGAWLRRKSIDELPQLINVIRGQMSLVGPRPLLSQELSDYGPGIDLYERVLPGITGLWQIRGRSHTTFAQRVSYDEWYIKNWTVWYDLVIILQTVRVLVRGGNGAY
jgi:undecaprenyl-phosphate galactose phosphotransferase